LKLEVLADETCGFSEGDARARNPSFAFRPGAVARIYQIITLISFSICKIWFVP